MACRGCLECLLKLLNFLLTLVGLAMVGYGIYLLVEYTRLDADSGNSIKLGQQMLLAVSLPDSFPDNLPKLWFIYAFIGIGVILFIISCFGCIGAATRNGCCLTCYSVLVILLILVELGCAAFIFFNKSWKEEIPADMTGALMVRAANRPADYDSDDEIIPVRQIRQPFLPRPPPATGVPVTGTLDQRSGRNDAWSTRMREKYGLDTAEFTYNPSESNRHPQGPTQQVEERNCCVVM